IVEARPGPSTARRSVIGRPLSHEPSPLAVRPAAPILAGGPPSMHYRISTLRDDPRLRRHFRRLHAVAWPRFLRDDALNAVWSRLYSDFPDHQIALVDGTGRVAAVGNTIPFIWDGTPRGLPDRLVDVVALGLDARERGRPANALSALAATVDPRRRGTGLSARIVRAMARSAARHGLRALVAPVRPSLKGRYPLTPMARYAAWTRP